jgi:hypothetical protein
MILQLCPPIPVETPHGEGMAIMVLDYGLQWNTMWVVVLRSDRSIKHYDSNDIKLSKNFTIGYV